jgi:hypothetical protein
VVERDVPDQIVFPADGEALRALYDRSRQLGEQLGVEHIEFRNAFPEQCVGKPNVTRF